MVIWTNSAGETLHDFDISDEYLTNIFWYIVKQLKGVSMYRARILDEMYRRGLDVPVVFKGTIINGRYKIAGMNDKYNYLVRNLCSMDSHNKYELMSVYHILYNVYKDEVESKEVSLYE